jgi:L-ribulokinase
MHAAVAAGADAGGFAAIQDAVAAMAQLKDVAYVPDPAAESVYDRLYAEYRMLHDYFGRGDNDVMKRLKQIKAEQRQ